MASSFYHDYFLYSSILSFLFQASIWWSVGDIEDKLDVGSAYKILRHKGTEIQFLVPCI